MLLMLSLLNAPIIIIIMDHLAVQCKKKLETFRIKELKDVLSRIGGRKQGKKQVLVDKIMALFLTAEMGHPMGPKLENTSTMNVRSREAVAKIVDEVYRTCRFGAPDLATTSVIDHGIQDSSYQSVRQKLSDGGQCATDSKMRCPCANKMEFGAVVQCDVPTCLARQHVNCVILPEGEDVKPEIPSRFYCEVCRLQHGDPFCVSVAHPLMPVKTFASFAYSPEGGATVVQSLEKSFTLSHHDWQLLLYPEYDLQIWCVLLGDEVAFRMQWPLKADLRVNGELVRVTNRPGHQKLGVNGRDDGPLVTNYTREGLNSVSFTAHDGRSFCLGVRILRRLTIDEVLCQIPREAEGESLDEALARVRRCFSVGATVGDDSDSDIEVVSEWVTVSLCCPMSGSRIKVAGRFRMCKHIGCFDLHTFVQLNQRTRKWQCPSCLKNYSLKDLIIDPFFTQIARVLQSYDEDVKEVEMKPDGSWRPKLNGDVKFKESWRAPLGLVMTNDLSEVCMDLSSGVSIEKLGFESKQDGMWRTSELAVSTISDIGRGDNSKMVKGIRSQNSIASVSRELSSINQEPMECYLNLEREEVEVNSCPIDVSLSVYSNGPYISDEGLTPAVILLSDEEDNSIGFRVANEEYCSSNPFELQEYEGGFAPCDYSVEPAAEEVGRSSLTVAVDFLGVGQGLSNSLTPKEKRKTDNEVQFSSFLNPASRDHSTYHCDFSTSLQTCTSNVSLNEFSRGMITFDISSTNYGIENADTLSQGYQNLCKIGSNGLVASESSMREFLPNQPTRSLSNITGNEQRSTTDSDNMQDGWFSLSLGGSEPFNHVATLYDTSDHRTEPDPLIEPASLLLELSHYQREVDESCFGSKRTEDSTVCSPDRNQKNYFCIDSDSD